MTPSTLLSADQAEALELADAVQTSPSGIVSRTLVQAAEVRVVLFAFAEGQELTPHSSGRRALVHILEGSCDFFFAGRWHRLGPGSFVHLPPGHPHAVKAAVGPFSMLLTLGGIPATPAV